MAHQEDDRIKKRRTQRLVQALSASLLVNLILSVLCIYEWQSSGYCLLKNLQCKPIEVSVVSSSEVAENLYSALNSLKDKSSTELLSQLNCERIIDDGYQVRDLALGVLTSKYHFAIQKALPNGLQPKQERVIQLTDEKITVYPGLSQDHFLAISHFVQEERFPFTAEGLFEQLKQDSSNPELRAAFVQTREYITCETVLKESGDTNRDTLVAMLLTGNWKMISDLVEGPKSEQDLSIEKQQKFILSYIALGSKSAAEYLIRHDREFAIHKLDDIQAMNLLGLLEDQPALCQEYALALLESNRKNEVWQFAMNTLIALPTSEGLKGRSRNDLLRFFGKKVPKDEKSVMTAVVDVKAKSTTVKPVAKKVEPTKAKAVAIAPTTPKPVKKSKKERTYIVQTGDNLWKISKKFRVQIEDIRFVNKLQSDALKPGTILRIPS
ncbi:MAG: hypothetical protein JWO53_354 [Chlamydiia bacterium]|nr:hypothetical protein [Chlamydiia bacterium]